MSDPALKANSPIEITIKIDPASVQNIITKPARAAWRAATGETARIVYWFVAALIALLILITAIANELIPARAVAVVLAIAIGAGLIALKRRYSPLIRD